MRITLNEVPPIGARLSSRWQRIANINHFGLFAVVPASWILVIGLFFLVATCVRADSGNLVLETASYPITGILSGHNGAGDLSIGEFQYLGVRFSLTQTTQISQIGGMIQGNSSSQFAGNLELFGAIASIDSPNGFPNALPPTFQPIAVTTFFPPVASVSTDTLVPLSVVLAPGNYALIFGSFQFGATGSGYMPYMSGDIGQQSFFVGSIHSTNGTDADWNNGDGDADDFRFVIYGTAVPEPSSLILAAFGLLGFILSLRTCFRST